ncbi:MepB family protein [Chryseobacterium oryctis]|uniref:MepB family protein n=1 Tax=Chryseobacterium oryctis TaxID=2952618 RepID=A0ABT3HMX7_9FLAO|nr:MepB family protein [Chryseobacterium oryctis]MCW3161141.1 MepB family protein [Chryseobacterium oryctis]
MIKELEHLQNLVFSALQLNIAELHKDLECEEYFGYNFKLNQFNIKFRKAKITPKKTGQFVTLWKRNPESNETEPFDSTDNFDFYLIFTESLNNQGFFFFDKKTLIQNQILTTPSKEGKRGFRVYPEWNIPKNKQAQKTKNWQIKSFINLSDRDHSEKIKAIVETST